MARAPRIAIDLEANVAGLITDMRQASQAVTQFTARAKQDMAAANAQVAQLSKGFSALGTFVRTSFAGIQTTTLLSTLAGLSDRYQNLDSKLKLVTATQTQYRIAQEGTRKIAKDTFSSLESTSLLYQRVANSVEGLGISQQKVLKITDTVSRAFLVSGATSEEAAASVIQLTQSLGSGYLRGQEFNSIAEQAPRLLKVLAQSMDVPRGALKSLANEGKITTEVMVKAFTGLASDSLAEESAKIPLTINRAFGLVRNAALIFVGEAGQTSGAAKSVAEGIKAVAENFAGLATTVVSFMKVGIVVFLARLAGATKAYIATQVIALQTQIAWTAAIKEDATRTLAASAVKTEAALAEQRATILNTEATIAAVAVSRQEALANLASANAQIKSAQATIAATKAIGVQSAAVRELRLAEVQLTQAQAARSASLSSLAVLGQQSSRLGVISARASTGRFDAAQLASMQAGMNALVASGSRMGVVSAAIGKVGSALLAFVGGPVGAAVIALIGLYQVFDHFSERADKAKASAKEFKDSLEEVSKTAAFFKNNPSASADSLVEQYFGSAATINDKKAQIAALEQQLESLYQQSRTRTAGDGASALAIFPQIEKTTESLARMRAQFAPAQAGFATMTVALRERLGPSFDAVSKAAATMSATNFQKFIDNLDPVVKAAIAKLSELQKKLNGIASGLGDTVTEMKRNLRDTGLDAASKARNRILDLVEDGKRANQGPEYFRTLARSAREYVLTADAQEKKEKSLAAATKSRTAATRELSAVQKKADSDRQAAESYIGGVEGRQQELEIELRTGENLGAAKRELIRFDYMLAESGNAYLKSQEGVIRKMLEANVAIEEQIAARKRQIEVDQRAAQVARKIEDYNEARAKQAKREVDAIKYGGNTAEQNARMQAISDEFRGQRRDIDDSYNQRLSSTPLDDKKARNDLQAEYNRLIGQTIIAEALAAEKEQQYLAERLKAQEDWRNGAVSALQDYMAEAGNVAEQSKQFFTRSFSALENFLVTFVTTGKASFKDFVQSILVDFIRMETRILMSKALQYILNSVFGAFTGSSSTASIPSRGTGPAALGKAFSGGAETTRFAQGGAFTNMIVNRATNVPMAQLGEAGDEAIMPLARDSSGKLGVAAQLSGGGGGVVGVEVNIINKGKPVDAESASRMDGGKLIIDMVIAEVDNRIARMGSTGKVIGQRFNMAPAGVARG